MTNGGRFSTSFFLSRDSIHKRLQPKQSLYSKWLGNQSSLDLTKLMLSFPSWSVEILLIVLPTSSKFFISSRTPKHKEHKPPSASGVPYNLEVNRMTVGTVCTLNPACSLLKNPSIMRSVLPKNGGCYLTA